MDGTRRRGGHCDTEGPLDGCGEFGSFDVRRFCRGGGARVLDIRGCFFFCLLLSGGGYQATLTALCFGREQEPGFDG